MSHWEQTRGRWGGAPLQQQLTTWNEMETSEGVISAAVLLLTAFMEDSSHKDCNTARP